MRVLLVKMSSLGDVIHTLPAVSDAATAVPGIRFDWVVEEAFEEVPSWHDAVEQTLPIALRRWRKRPFNRTTRSEWRAFRNQLQASPYDAVIDAQGLLKSAFVTRQVPARRIGLDKSSARESLAALAYDRGIAVPRQMHAIQRLRTLFAAALDYPLPETGLDYGIKPVTKEESSSQPPSLIFFHGSARPEKLWPEQNWMALADIAVQSGFRIALPWGSEQERDRSQRIARCVTGTDVLPRKSLGELAVLLSSVAGVVAVDTGLGHLSAALGVPTVSLYGPTETSLIGTRGGNQEHVKSPLLKRSEAGPEALMQAITPAIVWQRLESLMTGAASPCD